jgi:hypothetical protein
VEELTWSVESTLLNVMWRLGGRAHLMRRGPQPTIKKNY